MNDSQVQIRKPYHRHSSKIYDITDVDKLKERISYDESEEVDHKHELFLKRLAAYASISPDETFILPYALDVEFIDPSVIECFKGITNIVYPKSWIKYLEGKA